MQAFKQFKMNLPINKVSQRTTQLLLIITVFITSCKTGDLATSYLDKSPIITKKSTHLDKRRTGINRLTEYEFIHPDIPKGFDNITILFISDLHYPSLFKKEDIYKLSNYIKTLHYDILCLGGDYHEDVTLINTLFEELGKDIPRLGAYAVLGNNDYERGYKEVVTALKKNNIQLLEHRVIKIKYKKDHIYIAGVRNPFDLKENGISPTLNLSSKDFVILLTHTPDYAEDTDIRNTDLVLAGHTHGGQVRFLGAAPIIPSKYKSRFLTGLAYTDSNIPVLITNGIGTSNKNIRLGAPSELVLIHLKRSK